MKKLSILFVLILLAGLSRAQYWTPMELPAVSDKWLLTGVDFPTAETGFAVGYDYTDVDFSKAVVKGVILEYKEGKWVKAVYPDVSNNWQLNGLFFLNDREGYAVGLDKTKDAGIALHFKNGVWEIVDLPSPGFAKWLLYGAYFLNENDGWICGGTRGKDGPVLYHYKDGKWELMKSPDFKTQTIMSVTAMGSVDVFAGGFREGDLGQVAQISKANGSYIVRSTGDWAKEKLPLLSGNVICEEFGYIDKNNIYAVGYMPEFNNAPSKGKMVHFDGKKWEDVKLPDASREWSLSAVDFTGPDFGFAVGWNSTKNSGLILRFKKGEWETLDKKSEPQVSEKWGLHDVAYDGKNTWYAAGADLTGNKGIILQLK